MPSQPTVYRLRRWALARERRNGPGAHGKNGTALLREAANRIDELELRLAECETDAALARARVE
jgi:hypothetical protein